MPSTTRLPWISALTTRITHPRLRHVTCGMCLGLGFVNWVFIDGFVRARGGVMTGTKVSLSRME